MSILDLPIERQREIAAESGETHSAWVEGVKKRLQDSKRFIKELDANKGKRPEGFTDQDAVRFQKKVDSANPR